MPNYIERNPRAKYVMNRFGSKAILEDIKNSIISSAQAAGANIIESLVRTGTQPKSGEHYRGYPRRSSSYTEFPARQSGKYHDSLYYSRNTHSFTVGSNGTPRGHEHYLEDGTRRMAPRPTRMSVRGPLRSMIDIQSQSTRALLSKYPREQFEV